MNRRTFIKRGLGAFFGILGLSTGTYYYARDIETSMLHIQEETITSTKIPDTYNGFKIVQFSDTHIGFHYTLEQMDKLINKINSQQPDIIVFTGDLVDDPNEYHWNKQLINKLQDLEANFGKFWIYGNHDHGGYGTDILKKTMSASGFKLLKNEHATIDIDNERIIIAGIDDVILGKPDLKTTLQNVNPELFTILLAHEPDYADTASQYAVDVQLSGHSHGGQVRFPFVGSLYTPAYAEKYVQGKYTISDQLTLFVNKGVGTTRLPYRFFCKPEIHVYTLEKT